MRVRNGIPPAILTAATNMLQEFIPELSPQALVAALKTYGLDQRKGDAVAQPMTRKEAAAYLGISLVTLNQYLNTGILQRIRLGPRLVRVSREQVMALQGRNPGELTDESRTA